MLLGNPFMVFIAAAHRLSLGSNILPCQRRPYHGMDSGRSQVIHHSGIKMFKAHRVPLNLVRYQLSVDSSVKDR